MEALVQWDHLESAPHRFGGIEYRLLGTEIGHTHGDHQADIRFNRKKRQQLVEAGRAEPHHLYPDSGWVSFYIRREKDVSEAIALFREAYEDILARKSGQASPTNVRSLWK